MTGSPEYELVIGLEVHVQLMTETKLFCPDATSFRSGPNTDVSSISLGYPGTLPRLNKEVIPLAIRLGLALHSEITRYNYFARKHYFYPDLPKGYQITQMETPICKGGFLELPTSATSRKIRIHHIHIEEDAGKSIHANEGGYTNVDFNRAGMPLLEIVTEPDIRSAEEAALFVTRLRQLVRSLHVSDGNMESGNLRCDVNISVRKPGDTMLGTRVEIKNLNSFRFIRKAIEFEGERLMNLHRSGDLILQQTRGFNEDDGSTYLIRTKEEEQDYRYFPEPDLPPFIINEDMIQSISVSLPPTAEQNKFLLKDQFELNDYDAGLLAGEPDLMKYFIELSAHVNNKKTAANWVNGAIRKYLMINDLDLSQFPVTPVCMSQLVNMVEEGKITHATAIQTVFPQLIKEPALDIVSFVDESGLNIQTDDSEMENMIMQSLEKHADKIPAYTKGKKGLISVFVADVMKRSKGRADAQKVTALIIEKLKELS